ncbi:MAG: hypothetical protein J6U31_00110 [Bacteroidales bacterium]|nr:hypothetical protein [Bacteroidales bacterium]
MRIHLLLLSVLCWCLPTLGLQAQPEVQENASVQTLLELLDDAILNKSEYQRIRSERADSLSRVALRTAGLTRIMALSQRFDVYLHYQTDSAMSTLEWLKRLPEYETDQKLQRHILIDEARLYGMMGLYHKAYVCLSEIDLSVCDDELRLLYYNVKHAVLDWRADYASRTVPSLSRQMRLQAAVYHDSLLMLEPDAENRTIISTNRAYDNGQYAQCIDTLLHLLTYCNDGLRVFAYSRLSQAYGQINEPDLQLRYLILTAIADIRAGVTEYMALPELAGRLFGMGDVDRAYEYMFCALEDATLCKSNLRTIESSSFFPIIEQNRQIQLRAEKRNTQLVILFLVVIAVVMVSVILTQLSLNRKLQATRALLAQANNKLKISNSQLHSANLQLQNSDHIKGDYLMNYLTRSRNYLASIESFQRQMANLLHTRQYEELGKKLKSTEFIDEEQEKFYADFDELFLTLYPNFVEKFNALLKPEAAILPKKGELLTTELRIFALIRMGENDSTKIAKFLNYSLTTIYNYRSRTRNNAIGNKDTFEEDVMKL